MTCRSINSSVLTSCSRNAVRQRAPVRCAPARDVKEIPSGKGCVVSREPSEGRAPSQRLRQHRLALACLAVLASVASAAEPAFADFVGGGGGGVDESLYVYTTKDLAVDLVSPLVAFKVACAVFNQTTPRWLDAIGPCLRFLPTAGLTRVSRSAGQRGAGRRRCSHRLNRS